MILWEQGEVVACSSGEPLIASPVNLCLLLRWTLLAPPMNLAWNSKMNQWHCLIICRHSNHKQTTDKADWRAARGFPKWFRPEVIQNHFWVFDFQIYESCCFNNLHQQLWRHRELGRQRWSWGGNAGVGAATLELGRQRWSWGGNAVVGAATLKLCH